MTTREDTAARAGHLHRLHQGSQPLVLVNAWDAGSARVLEAAGAPVIATSSAAMAWALGHPDGEALPLADLLDTCGRIARVIRVPMTVDFERGFAASADAVAANVERLIGLGAVGINLEDGREAGALVPLETACERIAAARRAADRSGVRLFINARTDTYFLAAEPPGGRFETALERARRFAEAGADGIFVPGMDRIDEIRRFAAAIERPLNVYAGYPGVPDVPTLAAAGVRRVSVGCGPLQSAYGLLQRMARETLQQGRTAAMCEGMMSSKELNALFA